MNKLTSENIFHRLFYLFLLNSLTACFSSSGGNIAWEVNKDVKISTSHVSEYVNSEKPKLVLQTGITTAITAICFMPNAPIFATAGYDFSINIWAANKKRLLYTLPGHSAMVRDLSFSPDGKTLASASDDTTIKVWDVKTGRLIRTFTNNIPFSRNNATAKVYSVRFSPNGNLLAIGGKHRHISIFNLDNKNSQETRFLNGHSNSVTGVRFSPDGLTLASVSKDKTIKLWNLEECGNHFCDKGKSMATLSGKGIENKKIAFSPDGRTFASYGINSKKIIIYNLKTGEVFKKIGSDNSISSVSYTSNSNAIAVAYTDQVKSKDSYLSRIGVKIWNYNKGVETHAFSSKWFQSTARLGSVIDASLLKTMIVAFSPDGRYLAASYMLSPNFGLWDLLNKRVINSLSNLTTPVTSLVLHPNGKTLLSSNEDDGKIKAWDLDNSRVRVIDTKNSDVGNLMFTNDGSILATSDGHSISLWDYTTGKKIHTVEAENSLGGFTNNPVYDIEISPNGKYMAAAIWNVIKVVNLQNYQEHNIVHSNKLDDPNVFGVSSVSFSPDSKTIAFTSDDRVKLWDVESNKEIIKISPHRRKSRFARPNPKMSLNSVAFSPLEPILAIGGRDNIIRVWSLTTQSELRVMTGHSGSVSNVNFSSNGKFLVSSSGSTVKLWDVKNAQIMHTLEGHKSSISSVIISSDNKFVISGSTDDTIKIWDVENGVELVTLVSMSNGGWVAFTPEGFFDGNRNGFQSLPFHFPSNPLSQYEPEQFFNLFYQPGVVADVMREGMSIRDVLLKQGDPRGGLDISKYLDTVLPEVTITNSNKKIITDRLITLNISAKDNGMGLRDLRVFRNNSLIHYERGKLRADPDDMSYHLDVPVRVIKGKNEFTAYVFNNDDVKSKDYSIILTGADKLNRNRKAYVIAVGVNQYSIKKYNLNYAVADAKAIAASLNNSLGSTGAYSEVIPITLLDEQATKVNILTALDLLSGKSRRLPVNMPRQLTKLKMAEPEDAIIIYFAGHGTAGQSKNDLDRYYLLPHDLENISDLELEEAFENIDTGNFMLVIDACQSGQALEAEEKRRGPMNSRGLAQLAYEKGMYILAAAQSKQAAMELSELGHGLLTYTLIERGLKNQEADMNNNGQLTAREWFDYATQNLAQVTENASARYRDVRGQMIDGGEETVTGQTPKAYYRRELEGQPWVLQQ